MKFKRKLVAIVSSIALLFTFTPPTAFAQEGFVDSSMDAFYGDTEVSYRVYSSFYVTIPASISMDNPTGVISVTMDNIESGYHVSVYATNLDAEGKFEVVSNNGDTGKMFVTKDNGASTIDASGFIESFYPDRFIEGEGALATTYIQVTPDGQAFKPGTYTGTLSFRIACEQDS